MKRAHILLIQNRVQWLKFLKSSTCNPMYKMQLYQGDSWRKVTKLNTVDFRSKLQPRKNSRCSLHVVAVGRSSANHPTVDHGYTNKKEQYSNTHRSDNHPPISRVFCERKKIDSPPKQDLPCIIRMSNVLPKSVFHDGLRIGIAFLELPQLQVRNGLNNYCSHCDNQPQTIEPVDCFCFGS